LPLDALAGGMSTESAVLYVDPDPDERAAAALSAVGLSPTTVGDADATLDRLAETGIRCVVSEHELPDSDGLALLERVRDLYPTLPFVLYTGTGGERLASDAVAAGVSEYVPKPPVGSHEEMAERTHRLVADGRRDAGTDPEAGPAPDHGAIDGDVPEPLKERAMDEAPVGITIADAGRSDEPLVYINEAFQRLTGYEADTALGQNCRFLQGAETETGPVDTMRRAIDAEEPASVELINYRKDGSKFWNKIDIAPILNDAGELTHYVGFQTDITDRKRAEAAAERRAAEVERERENLETLIDRVNGLIQDVTGALMAADSRTEIERRLCEHVGGQEPYAFAWVGDRDLANDAVRPKAATPGAEALIEHVDVDFEADDPVRRAVDTREVQVVDDSRDLPAGRLHGGDWPDRFRSMAAVPLAYRESLYGVLAVYATEPGAFDDRERVVLGALGRTAATAINAVESRRGLTTDEVTELEFDLSNTDLFFVSLARTLDCPLTYEGAVEDHDGGLALLFDVVGADPGMVREALPPGMEATLLTETDEGCLFEFVAPDSIVETLGERGVEPRSIEVRDGSARLTVHVPRGADDRELVEFVTHRYDGAELVAYRERERQTKTDREFIATIQEALTERQRAALQRAYAGGFFEWPRSVDGEDLATSMDVSRSTFHQHLRAAERKLVSAFQEGAGGNGPSL
jgi:PAS domain S-box-containing protein